MKKVTIKHKKLWISIGIVVAAAVAVIIANIVYSRLNPVSGDLYGTWYEYDEGITLEELKAGHRPGELIINEDKTLAYYPEPAAYESDSVDYFTDAADYSLSSVGKWLLPWGTYTFHYPSFRIHSLSDYKVEGDRLDITIDGKKHVFFNNKKDIFDMYVKQFFDKDSVAEYFKSCLEDAGVEAVSYAEFYENISGNGNCYIMFSEYVEYNTVEKINDFLEEMIGTGDRNWYYIDGRVLSENEKKLLSGTEISGYLNKEVSGYYNSTLETPVVSVLDGSNNPKLFEITTQNNELLETLKN